MKDTKSGEPWLHNFSFSGIEPQDPVLSYALPEVHATCHKRIGN
jgi:hypothetical protein